LKSAIFLGRSETPYRPVADRVAAITGGRHQLVDLSLRLAWPPRTAGL